MKYLIYCLVMLGTISFNNLVLSQTYTTESKSCGSCGKAVSNNSRIGMTCPHCGVRWGHENETRTTSYKNSNVSSYKSTRRPSYDFDSYSSPIGMVNTNVNLRAEPSTKARIIKILPSYSTVNIIRRRGDWLYVEYQDFDMNTYKSKNIQGYLHKSVVR